MKKALKYSSSIITFIMILTMMATVKAVGNTTNTSTASTSKSTTSNTTSYSNSSKTSSSATTNTTKKTTSTTSSVKSSNANLTTLGVSPKEYDFSGFSKDKTSYGVTVPSNVNSLKVAYKTESPKATVRISGNQDLEVGTNTIKVIVTAENGTKKTYTIRVTKLATEDDKPGNVIDEDLDVDVYLTKLDLKGLTLSPEFKSSVFSYEATIDMDKNDMTSVAVEAKANSEKATVEITGNENLSEGENLINVIIKSPTSSEQTVYQITVNKVSKSSEIVPDKVMNTVKSMDKKYIIGAIAAIIALLALIIVWIKKKKNKDYYDAEEDDFAKGKLYNQMEDETPEYTNHVSDDTIQEIQEETNRIFNKPKGETVEYTEQEDDDYIEKRLNKRKKGKHF